MVVAAVRALAVRARVGRQDRQALLADGHDLAQAEVVRPMLDSLASAYRRTVDSASTIAGVGLEVVHVVGGGSQEEPLCQLAANACGLPDDLVRRTRSLRRYAPTTGPAR